MLVGIGEMIQWLRVLAILPEYSGSIIIPIPGDAVPTSGLY